MYDLNLVARLENNRLDAYRAAYIGKTVGADKAEPAKASPVALVKAGHPPECFLAPNEGHGFYDTKNVTEFYQRLERFLGKHLGP